MEARDIQVHLRRCGVVVHLAARMPMASDGRHSVVVFLEARQGQFELPTPRAGRKDHDSWCLSTVQR